MRIALIHYAAPPVIGGVERVIAQQARVLAAHGHDVVVLCGNKGAEIPGERISVRVFPQLAASCTASSPSIVSFFPPPFLDPSHDALASCEIAIVHNIFTMPFNEEASRELARVSRSLLKTKFINWVHDVDVSPDVFAAWNPRAVPVAVSRLRRAEFCAMAGLRASACEVVPNGMDPEATLGLSDEVGAFARQHRLLDRDLVLFHPTRVLARKNLELGIEVLAALRRRKKDAVLVVTGAPDRHRKESAAYAAAIQERITKLKLRDFVLYVGEAFPVTDRHVAEFYSVADALFFPSRREGFGLPLLEAAVHRLPVFCSDIPIHREILGRMASFFPLDEKPPAIAARILRRLDRDATFRRRKIVLRKFGWQRIYRENLEPLLRAHSKSHKAKGVLTGTAL